MRKEVEGLGLGPNLGFGIVTLYSDFEFKLVGHVVGLRACEPKEDRLRPFCLLS